jgi:hypothetical protein
MSHYVVLLVKWLAAVGVVGSLSAGAYFFNKTMKEKNPSDSTSESVQAPDRIEKRSGGQRVIKLNARAADSYGLETQLAREAVWKEQIVVHGRVVSNPRATYEVRAPFAGTLQAVDGTPWPTPGQTVRSGQVLARLAVRVGPQERLDFHDKLTQARLKRDGAQEVCKKRQELVARLKAKPGGVSWRELDDAEVTLIEAETQLASAKASLELLQQCVDEIDALPAKGANQWSKALAAPAENGTDNLEVTELGGQPDTAVEAGGLVARLVDFTRPLVRLDVPAELLAAGAPPREIQLTTVPVVNPLERGTPTQPVPVKAVLVGPVGQIDASSQFVGYLYQIESGSTKIAWRPGLFVQARLPAASGEGKSAIEVPASAILYHQGRTLVYVQCEEDAYERREVQILGQEGDRCFLAPLDVFLEDNKLNFGVKPGEKVVSSQAQVLLSTEFGKDND